MAAIEQTEGTGGAQGQRLAGDRRLEVSEVEGESRLIVRSPSGDPELEIIVTANGPVLRTSKPLTIETESDLALRGKRVSIEGQDTVDIRSHGRVRIDADGPVQSVGLTQEVRARAGNVDLKANDDVRAQGERIRLNC